MRLIDGDAVIAEIQKLIDQSTQYTAYEAGLDDACTFIQNAEEVKK